MFLYTVLQFVFLYEGTALFQKSFKSESMERMKLNDHYFEDLTPVLAVVDQVLTFGRVPLMLFSFKNLRVGKLYYAYMMLSLTVEMTYPNDWCKLTLSTVAVNQGLIYAAAFSHYFILDGVIAILMNVYMAFFVQPNVFYVITPIREFAKQFIYQLMFLSLIRFFIQLLGFLFVEADIMRKDGEVILDNLRQGVVIIEADTNEVQFVNLKAAKTLKIEPTGAGTEEIKLDLTARNFVRVCPELLSFEDQVDDKVMKISELDEYLSIEEVIIE